MPKSKDFALKESSDNGLMVAPHVIYALSFSLCLRARSREGCIFISLTPRWRNPDAPGPRPLALVVLEEQLGKLELGEGDLGAKCQAGGRTHRLL